LDHSQHPLVAIGVGQVRHRGDLSLRLLDVRKQPAEGVKELGVGVLDAGRVGRAALFLLPPA
jgi:hypothetical protein